MYQVVVFDKNKSPLEITKYTIEKMRSGQVTEKEDVPGDMEALSEKLDKILEQMEYKSREEIKYAIFPYKGDEIIIDEKDIIYIEREKRTTKIHLPDNVLETSLKLTEMEKYLDNTNIIRCHNSFAVNLENVSIFSRTEFTMRNQVRVPISRSRYKEVREAFQRWAGNTNLKSNNVRV